MEKRKNKGDAAYPTSPQKLVIHLYSDMVDDDDLKAIFVVSIHFQPSYLEKI